jgi:hypothetical protein
LATFFIQPSNVNAYPISICALKNIFSHCAKSVRAALREITIVQGATRRTSKDKTGNLGGMLSST